MSHMSCLKLRRAASAYFQNSWYFSKQWVCAHLNGSSCTYNIRVYETGGYACNTLGGSYILYTLYTHYTHIYIYIYENRGYYEASYRRALGAKPPADDGEEGGGRNDSGNNNCDPKCASARNNSNNIIMWVRIILLLLLLLLQALTGPRRAKLELCKLHWVIYSR